MVNLLIGGELGIAFMLTGPTDSRLVARTMVSEPMVLVSSIRNVAVPRGLVDLTSTPPLKLAVPWGGERSEEHTSELQSLMRISYAVFCLKKKKYSTPSYTIHEISKNNKCTPLHIANLVI